jgi:3-dehydroquinate synthetase
MPPDSVVRVRVESVQRPYSVLIGSGLLETLGQHLVDEGLGRKGGRAFLAFDDGVPAPDVLVARAGLELAGLAVHDMALHASERDKSLPALQALLVEIAGTRHERGEPIVALGGGIIGDMVGFAAACYRRGVPMVNCPTTLLAMVDASIGGKTSVNLDLGGEGGLKKNMVGAFHQPALVVSDVTVLQSLEPRHFRAGLAECVKQGMVASEAADEGLLGWLEMNLGSVLEHDLPVLAELVERNVRVKGAIVSADEHEETPDGGRMLLNLGHTFGHAIETLSHLTPDGDPAHAPLLHGEAVGLGLVAAASTARELDLCDAACVDQVVAVVSRCGLPVEIGGMPPAARILELMAHDKKVRGSKMRLILPTGPGRAKVVADPPLKAVMAGIEAIRA